MLRALVVALSVVGSVHGYSSMIKIDTSHSINTISPKFKSWNIDSSANRGFFSRNLTDPHLTYIAKNSEPGFCRFGGTGNDELYYGVSDNCAGQAASGMQYCLNGTHFLRLWDFVESSGAELVFGLNIMFRKDGKWDPSNARDLLTYGMAHGVVFSGVELGNEKNEVLTPQQAAEDFVTLQALLVELYPSESSRPTLHGPDPHSFKGVPPNPKLLSYLEGFVQSIKDANVPLHAVTHHEYIEVNASNSLSSSVLDDTGVIASAVNHTVRSILSDVEVWAGEIGPHNGGSPGCDTSFGRWTTFADSFWYIDAMGSKAKAGYQVFCRQDFVGVDYGVVDCAAYTPFPDYYTGIVWGRTMGTKVLSATSSSDSLRVYAHCSSSGSGVTAVLLNLASEPATAVLSLSGKSVSQYQFTSPSASVNTTSCALNGVDLVFDSSSWKLPELKALSVPNGGKFALPAESITFLEFDGSEGVC